MKLAPLTVALAACGMALITGCCRKPTSDPDPIPVVDPNPTPTVTPAVADPAPTFAVPFAGSYRKHASSTYQGGRKIKSATNKGSGLLVVTAGTVTYSQTYPRGSGEAHVTQVFTFTQSDMKPQGTGWVVNLTFVRMDTDSPYNPDKLRPRLEVVKSNLGWEIGLMATDEKGVMGGSEFDPT